MLLMIIPCAIKRELKQIALFEKERQSTPGQYKVSCATFYQFNKIDKKEKITKQILPPPSLFSTQEKEYVSCVKKIISLDFFSYQKEKISSYLLFEQFLI